MRAGIIFILFALTAWTLEAGCRSCCRKVTSYQKSTCQKSTCQKSSCQKISSQTSSSKKSSCRKTVTTTTYHVSARVGENEMPTQRIGVKQSFEGVVSKVGSDGTIWVKADGSDHPVADKDGKVKVWLDRIDAPDDEPMHMRASTEALSKKLLRKTVRIDWKKRDMGIRIFGVVYLEGEDVNLWMVQEGYARHDSRHDATKSYTAAERSAKANRLGIWSDAAKR